MSVKAMLVSKLQVAFGDYVEGLTAENLKMQVMAGTIEQQDLRLKKAARSFGSGAGAVGF